MAERTTPDGDDSQQFGSDYDIEVTDVSQREIQRLALWARARGPQFYLIGGWAAWSYHRGVGSRDIDLIFPDERFMEAFLNRYYRENGYVWEGSLIEGAYRKPVATSKGTFYIEIDAAPMNKGLPFHENHSIDLPYGLLRDHHRNWSLGREEVMIATPDLLLLEKVKAMRDRTWDLEHMSPTPVRAQHLRSKIKKDAYDISMLSSILADWQVVAHIAETHACKGLVSESLRALGISNSL